jgi:phage-related protein
MQGFALLAFFLNITHNQMNDPQKIESAPSVTLIITDNHGEITYLATVANTTLEPILRTASQLKDYPVERQEYQLDNLGQEIYKITSSQYFGALVGTFLPVSWETAKGLLKFSQNEDLKFTLAVSY